MSNRSLPRAALLGLSLMLTACGAATYSSSVAKVPAPPYRGVVTVRAGSVPEGAEELGTIEAYCIRWKGLDAAVDEFRDVAAELGGDFAKIDEIRTEWGMASGQTTTQTATTGAPTRSRDYTTVGTKLIGRAYRTKSP